MRPKKPEFSVIAETVWNQGEGCDICWLNELQSPETTYGTIRPEVVVVGANPTSCLTVTMIKTIAELKMRLVNLSKEGGGSCLFLPRITIHYCFRGILLFMMNCGQDIGQKLASIIPSPGTWSKYLSLGVL